MVITAVVIQGRISVTLSKEKSRLKDVQFGKLKATTSHATKSPSRGYMSFTVFLLFAYDVLFLRSVLEQGKIVQM